MVTKKINFIIIFIYLFLIYFIANKMYSFPESLSITKILEVDGMFTQVQIQSFIDGAIFGSTDNLGYPLGYSHWVIPQFGLIDSVFIWLLGNSTTITNYGLLSLIGLFTILLNLISMFILGLMINQSKITAFTFGLIGLTTPFALNSLIHVHVMKIFIIPVVLILLIQITQNDKLKKSHILIYLIVIFNSSLFWINVLFAIIFVLIFIELMDRIVFKSEVFKIKIYLKLFAYVLIGLLFHAFLYIYNSSLMGARDRFPWQSDIFSGKFTDALTGSPFLNTFVPGLTNLLPGTSTEAWSNMLGIPLMFSFFLAIYFILSSSLNKNPDILTISLKQFTIVSIFFFVIGGLSNLQAAFFVLFGSATPMRTWSRLSILIAILGLVLCLVIFKNKLRQIHLLFISIFVSFFAIIDLLILPPLLDNENTWIEQESYNSINFIASKLEPCPVLQLPVDSYLLPQGWLDNATRYYWTNLIPYVILPEFKWSAATYTDSAGWKKFVEPISGEIGSQDFELFSKTYCAVYFDKNFSQYQIDREASLNGIAGFWPGLRIKADLTPDFDDSRYSVYLLKRN